MKAKKGMRLASALLAVLFAVCVLPGASLAEWPDYLKITEKTGFDTNPSDVPDNLKKGEVWVDRVARSTEDSPSATVEISALGRQFTVTEQITRKYNIMFVLDMSNSMNDNGKVDTMVTSANAAVAQLAVFGNKVGLVTFGTSASVKRSLSTTAFTLKTSGNSTTNSINVKPSGGSDGGTNMQAGLNVAYNALKASITSVGEIPVIILLSDGAPTYYYNAIDTVPVSGSVSGPGNNTTNTEIGMTLVQAAYLKAMLPGMSIYTISFDINSAQALATLNPTDTNLANVDGLVSYANSVVNKTTTENKKTVYTYVKDAAIRTQILNRYNYVSGAYSANNSVASLSAALANIINKIKESNPIAESPVSANDPTLAETSYLRITDTIGEGFDVGTTATIHYKNKDYTFTRSSGTKYAYSGDDADMNRVVLTYNSGSRALVWKIPGEVLPCISADGAVKPEPIKLTYTVTLSDNNLEAKLYEISSKCEVWFRPASDNPNYPYAFVDNVAEKKDIAMTKTTYNGGYRAVFTVNGSSTQLLRFGTRTKQTDAYSYLNSSTKWGKVSNVAYTNPGLNLRYDGKNIAFNESTQYSVDVTISSANSLSSFSVASFKIDNVTYSGTVSATRVSDRVYNFTITFQVDNQTRTYTFNQVTMVQDTGSTKKYSATVPLYYRITELSDIQVDNYVAYNEAAQTLVLSNAPSSANASTNGTVTLVAGVVGNVTTTIDQLDDGTFIATKISQNGDGTFVETVFTVSNNKLNVKTTTRTLSTTTRADQNYTLGSDGAMLVTSNDVINNVTLTSEKGGATVTATPMVVNGVRDYKASVILTFYAKAGFSGLSFTLDAVSGSKTVALDDYTILGWSQDLTRNADGTFSSNAAGTYAIVIQTTNPYKPSVPASFLARFNSMSYQVGASAPQIIEHNSSYTNQQVKVIMSSPTKH